MLLGLKLQKKILEILNVIEFTSERKKSSIIVKDDGIIKLYIKGADSEMIPIINSETNPNFKEQSKEFIEFFSRIHGSNIPCGETI